MIFVLIKMILYLLLIIAASFSAVSSQSTTESNNGSTENSYETIQPTSTTASTSTPIYFLVDGADTLTWSPKSNDFIIIEAAEGYKIAVNITDCNIDGEHGEYATINTEDLTNGLTFSYTLSGQPGYVYNSNRLVAEFNGTDASNFTAIFTRIGEPLTTSTTEIPTTSIYLPTPNSNVSSTLVVYLAGKRASEYGNTESGNALYLLIEAIAGMAATYCENENFALNGTITSDNVIINQLTQCPMNWPDIETCVQVNFSIPVNLREDTTSLWTGYQMTTEHLEIMWARYASSYLPSDVTIFSVPDTSKLKWGIVIAGGIAMIFVACLLAIRHYGIKFSKMMRQRKLSDADSIIPESDRNSQISLPPHYLQDTPALFENAYPMYNPDKSPSYSQPYAAKTFEYVDYQDRLEPEMKETSEHDAEESGA